MKRYEMVKVINNGNYDRMDIVPTETDQGEWVKFEDAEIEIKQRISTELLRQPKTDIDKFTLHALLKRIEALEDNAHCPPKDEPPIRQRSAGLNDFKDAVNGLSELLNDPHPGLSTWHMMLSQKVKELNDIWNS